MEFNSETFKEVVYRTGKTQNDIALEIGVSPITLSKWLNGHQKPKRRELYKIAQIFPDLNLVSTETVNNSYLSDSSAKNSTEWSWFRKELERRDKQIEQLLDQHSKFLELLGKPNPEIHIPGDGCKVVPMWQAPFRIGISAAAI